MVRLAYRPLLVVSLIFALALLGTVITVQAVFAHEYNPKFRWYSSTVTVKDLTSSYSTQVDTAVFEYDNYTDMDWSESSSGNMRYVEADFGPTGWIAAGIAERPANNGYIGCISYPDLRVTGHCNTTNLKARRGQVYLNTNYQNQLDAEIDNVVLHEPGHVLGMAHTECSVQSVMKPGNCGNSHIILKLHDKLHINSWY